MARRPRIAAIPLHSAVRPPAEFMSAVSEWLDEHAAALLDDPNIVGISVGPKRTEAAEAGTLAIIFSVIDKPARHGTRPAGSRRIPASVRIAGADVPTDVVQRHFGEAHDSGAPGRTGTSVCPGLSIDCGFGPGTIGAIVTSDRHPGPLALTNNHVLREAGHMAHAPAAAGEIGRVIAVTAFRETDAAVAAITGRTVAATPVDLPAPLSVGPNVGIGDFVVKSGAVSGITYGTITEPDARIMVRYTFGARLIRGFIIDPWSGFPAPGGVLAEKGDSGSAWMRCDMHGVPTTALVGIHVGAAANMAGGSSGAMLACHASAVFAQLGLRLWRGSVAAEVVEFAQPPPMLRMAAPAPIAGARPMVVVTRGNLHLRAFPSLAADIIGRLPSGTLVDALTDTGDWAQIDIQGTGHADGYVWRGYLRAPA